MKQNKKAENGTEILEREFRRVFKIKIIRLTKRNQIFF